MLRSGAASLCCYSKSTFDLVTNIVVSVAFCACVWKNEASDLRGGAASRASIGDYYSTLLYKYNYNCRTAVGRRSVVLLENIFREITHFRIELEFNNTAADTTHHVVQNYFLPFYHIQFR